MKHVKAKENVFGIRGRVGEGNNTKLFKESIHLKF